MYCVLQFVTTERPISSREKSNPLYTALMHNINRANSLVPWGLKKRQSRKNFNLMYTKIHQLGFGIITHAALLFRSSLKGYN